MTSTPTGIRYPFWYLHLIDPLIASVMGPENKRHHQMVLRLIDENHSLGGHPNGFFYLGQRYCNLKERHLLRESLRSLVPSLNDVAHDLHQEIMQARADEQKLRQALSLVLPKCESNQDVRDVLPEVFIREVADLRHLPRTRPEGFLLEGRHPMLRQQYNKAVQIAKYYTANKILY